MMTRYDEMRWMTVIIIMAELMMDDAAAFMGMKL
jgi:hypothetical protein